jgi:hypothetical protein
MTTPLDKPVSRLAHTTRRCSGKLRRLVITLLPGDVIELREQGTQHRLIVSIDAVYSLASKYEALRLIAERKAKRKARAK